MKDTKKSKKITGQGAAPLKFDGGEDRLDRSIQKRMDEGDYFTALRLMNRRNDFFPATVDSCAVQADLYELTEVNTQALKTWYRFLNLCEDEALPEAYEGLAVNYMNLGRESQAAYYYNLLLRVDDELTDESKMDIVEMFSKAKKELFRTVYPPEKADYTEEIDQGLRDLKESKFQQARETFERVEKGSRQYKSAQNLIAVTCLLEDEKDEALARCEKLIAEDENDVQANTTYAAVLGQFERREEAKVVARKLSTIETSDTDELYKIATVCCENGLHAEALQKFIRLEEDIKNDCNLLYFKAVAAFNSGDIKLSIDTFEKLLTLYPAAAVARYYYDVLRYYEANKDKEDISMPELSYFYRVPQKVRENYCELLCFLDKLNAQEAQAVANNPQVLTVLQWAFDEMDGNDFDLQVLALCAAVHCRYEQFVQDILLDPDVSDVVKMKLMHLIVLQNKETSYGVVIYHIYRRIRFYRIKTGLKKRKKFLDAYAAVYVKFSLFSDNHAQRIRAAGELLYNCLSLREATAYIDGEEDVSCVIYMLAGIKEAGTSVEAAATLFDANTENVAQILELVQDVTGEVLRQNAKKQERSEEE